ncbi:hypothetical protein, partial [Edaphobacter sp. HDX4]|uniref:hypothetical protein n=1 Tax=Edaphobacter sp. HDX4 TaxID=2794064 RepID=UPI002FE680C4
MAHHRREAAKVGHSRESTNQTTLHSAQAFHFYNCHPERSAAQSKDLRLQPCHTPPLATGASVPDSYFAPAGSIADSLPIAIT